MAKPVRIQAWYRVELDSEGAVISSKLVESAGADRGGVFYIRAKSPEAAGKAAFNAYYKLRLRARRAKLRAEGKCDCGRARDVPVKPGSKELRAMCAGCLKNNMESHERKRRRDAGEDVPSPDKSETLRLRREAERSELRLDTLRQVNRQFLALPKVDFMRWLQKELTALVGRSAA